jgi:hypothetical protein
MMNGIFVVRMESIRIPDIGSRQVEPKNIRECCKAGHNDNRMLFFKVNIDCQRHYDVKVRFVKNMFKNPIKSKVSRILAFFGYCRFFNFSKIEHSDQKTGDQE